MKLVCGNCTGKKLMTDHRIFRTVLLRGKNKIDKMFPSIFYVIQLTWMLPVSAASVERTHSSLKMIKSDKRIAMLQERLNTLILLRMYKDIKLDYEDIVDRYARRNPRRKQLMNPLSE